MLPSVGLVMRCVGFVWWMWIGFNAWSRIAPVRSAREVSFRSSPWCRYVVPPVFAARLERFYEFKSTCAIRDDYGPNATSVAECALGYIYRADKPQPSCEYELFFERCHFLWGNDVPYVFVLEICWAKVEVLLACFSCMLACFW